MKASPVFTRTSETFVQVVDSIGEWFVRIVENGEVTAFQSFDFEEFATSYADGHRTRLGLAEFQRLTRDAPVDPAIWAKQISS